MKVKGWPLYLKRRNVEFRAETVSRSHTRIRTFDVAVDDLLTVQVNETFKAILDNGNNLILVNVARLHLKRPRKWCKWFKKLQKAKEMILTISRIDPAGINSRTKDRSEPFRNDP
jgi:hypothetical protein